MTIPPFNPLAKTKNKKKPLPPKTNSNQDLYANSDYVSNSRRSTSYPVLVPGLDLLNHSEEESVGWTTRPLGWGSNLESGLAGPSKKPGKSKGKGKGKAKTKANGQDQTGQAEQTGEVGLVGEAEKHELVFCIKRELKSGEQVFKNYGPRSELSEAGVSHWTNKV
jgi:hypothetical protein